jgi:uncharacterized protein YoxC
MFSEIIPLQLLAFEIVAIFTLFCLVFLAINTRLNHMTIKSDMDFQKECIDMLRKRVSILESEVQELERQNSLLCDAVNAWRRSSNDGK